MARPKRREGSALAGASGVRACIQAGGLSSTRALISTGALISACAFGAIVGCATMEPTIPAEPGVAFELPVGKTAAVNGSGARITFKQVKEDSRCPTDVTCIWAGDARIELTISRSGSGDDTKILSLSPANSEGRSGDLQIRFVGLTPVPRQADGNAPRAYVAQLVVNRI
jgi:hypothetical protein